MIQRKLLNYSNLQILKLFSRGMLNKLVKLISGFLQEQSNNAQELGLSGENQELI